jgi:hypothetical protein
MFWIIRFSQSSVRFLPTITRIIVDELYHKSYVDSNDKILNYIIKNRKIRHAAKYRAVM